jgi:hypothetical protein
VNNIVAGHNAADEFEFAELAYGIDRELFAGVPGEDAMERMARLDVAHDVLADLRKSDPDAARIAAELLRTAPAPLANFTAYALLTGGIPRTGKVNRAAVAA